MTPQGVKIEITKFVSYLLKEDLALTYRSPIIRRTSEGRREVAAPRPLGGRSMRMGLFGTMREYRLILQDGDYLVVLTDGSILQMMYSFNKNGSLHAHRLAYFPCPVINDLDILETHNDLEAAISIALEDPPIWPGVIKVSDDETALRLRSPIRFDYSDSPVNEAHSASHAHISMDTCRLPVTGPLSTGHFIRFIFKNFLADVWREHERIRTWPIRYSERTIKNTEMDELFLST